MINRSEIIATALKYRGIKEGGAKHKKLVAYYNKVKPDGYTAKIKDDWCAIAVSAWAIEAYGVTKAKKYFPLNASCPRMITKAKLMHIWIESDKFLPRPGDLILYDWQDSGKGDNKGTPDHVGLVLDVTGSIMIIEGNKSNTVGIGTIKRDAKYIRGYITPDYSEVETTVEQLAREVLAGKYGNGSERRKALGSMYDKVQAEVNRILEKEGRRK